MACVVGAAVGVVVPQVEQGEETVNDTETRSVTELEELLDEEIPCGGVANRHCRRECDQPAVLRNGSHRGCTISADDPHNFKCIGCWQVWYSHMARRLANQGFIRCRDCGQDFDSVESFADYRPF